MYDSDDEEIAADSDDEVEEMPTWDGFLTSLSDEAKMHASLLTPVTSGIKFKFRKPLGAKPLKLTSQREWDIMLRLLESKRDDARILEITVGWPAGWSGTPDYAIVGLNSAFLAQSELRFIRRRVPTLSRRPRDNKVRGADRKSVV